MKTEFRELYALGTLQKSNHTQSCSLNLAQTFIGEKVWFITKEASWAQKYLCTKTQRTFTRHMGKELVKERLKRTLLETQGCVDYKDTHSSWSLVGNSRQILTRLSAWKEVRTCKFNSSYSSCFSEHNFALILQFPVYGQG